VTVAGLLGALGGMGRIDLTLYDRAVSLSGRPASPEILIVMIDDDSIATLGRWPWSRTVHAALLDKLGEARAVGLDIIFAEPDRAEPAVDAQLAEAIRRNGKVVLPATSRRSSRWRRPPPHWASSMSSSIPTACCGARSGQPRSAPRYGRISRCR